MNTPSWESINSSLSELVDLSRAESTWAMNQIMSGETDQAVIKNFLLAMNEKAPTAQEVSGLVDAMLENAAALNISNDAIDIVGTGGDKFGTVNISTASAIVVAAMGIPVIKHGNRAASSKSGSADVLEAFGLNLNLTPSQVGECFEENKITFCFAPVFHPAMKHAAQVRKELNVPTVFNILGPLANPAQPKAQATGVANAQMAPLMAEVFSQRGTRAIVMRGKDGLDEMSISQDTHIWDVRSEKIIEQNFELASIGLKPIDISGLLGGDASENAQILKSALAGESNQAITTAISLNAAAALVAYQNPEGSFNEAMGDSFEQAKAVLHSGAALTLLENWVRWTQLR
jgi:anthranilate phosphoribosyltransferase